MAGEESMEHRQWSELHPDLLNKIAELVCSSGDYVRVRATCKAWNLVLRKVPNHIRGPWLVLGLDEDTFDVETISRQLRVPHLRMPELNQTLLRGSYCGWLISVGIHNTLQVLNPFTKSRFNLPPLSTFPGVVSYLTDEQVYIMEERTMDDDVEDDEVDDEGDNEDDDDDDEECDGVFTAFHMQKSYVDKVVFSCSSDHHKEFMAVAIYGEFGKLAFYRHGDHKWTHVYDDSDWSYDDVTFHEGRVYAIEHGGNLFEFDMKTPLEGIRTVPPPYYFLGFHNSGNHMKYLVWNPNGDLLLLIRHTEIYPYDKVRNGEQAEYCYKTSRFDVYKLNRSEKQWSKESSLGDYIIVVGLNSSFWMQPFSDGEGNWVRDCIYYSDDKLYMHYAEVIGGHDVGVFYFQNEKTNQLFPNSDLLYPPPVWVSHP